MFMFFHNKANSSSQKSGCSSIVKSTLKVCFMCQAREFGRCTSFGTLPKTPNKIEICTKGCDLWDILGP